MSDPDLRTRLRAVTPTLSPAARQVVAVIEADPAGAAHRTVHQVARDAATSPASVVRVARALGFAGYPQLRLALAALAAQTTEDVAPLGADVAPDDDAATVVAKLADFEIEQLRQTAALLDPDVVTAVAASCAAARRIAVYGVGASGLVATDLAGKLARLGLWAQAHTARDAALPDAALLRHDDTAVGISHSGRSGGALEPLRLAADRGATTVALTGMAQSPLAATAEHVLVTAGHEFGFRSAAMASRTGQLLATDTVFVAVAQRVPGARDALRSTYDSLQARKRSDA